MGAQRHWRHFHWGGNFAIIKMKKKNSKSSEIQTTVFNRINAAALIRVVLIKTNLEK